MVRKVVKSRGSRTLTVKRQRNSLRLAAARKRVEAAKSVASSLAKTLAAVDQIWTVEVRFPGNYGKSYHYLFDRKPERPFAVVNVGNDGYKVVTVVGASLGASALATKWLVNEIDDRAYQARKSVAVELDARRAAVRARLAEVAASVAGREALLACDETLRALVYDVQAAEHSFVVSGA